MLDICKYRNTEKHLFSTNNEVLMFLDSVRRSPMFIVFLRRSEPAKSQNEILKLKYKYYVHIISIN